MNNIMLKIAVEESNKEVKFYDVLGYDGNFTEFVNNLNIAGYQRRGELGKVFRNYRFKPGDVLVMDGYHVKGVYDPLDFAQVFKIIARSDRDDFEEFEQKRENSDSEDECEDGYCDGDEPEQDQDDNNEPKFSFNDISQAIFGVNADELGNIDDILKDEQSRERMKSQMKTSFGKYSEQALQEAEKRAEQARVVAKDILDSLNKKL